MNRAVQSVANLSLNTWSPTAIWGKGFFSLYTSQKSLYACTRQIHLYTTCIHAHLEVRICAQIVYRTGACIQMYAIVYIVCIVLHCAPIADSRIHAKLMYSHAFHVYICEVYIVDPPQNVCRNVSRSSGLYTGALAPWLPDLIRRCIHVLVYTLYMSVYFSV